MNTGGLRAAALALIALPAVAGGEITVVAGEVGVVFAEQPSTRSRSEVLAELRAWKLAPVSAAGWREVHGQAGWEFVAGASSLSREQVRVEASSTARQAVTGDGYRFVGGDVGWVYVGASAAEASALRTGLARR